MTQERWDAAGPTERQGLLRAVQPEAPKRNLGILSGMPWEALPLHFREAMGVEA